MAILASLSSEEAQKRLKQFGPNVLPEAPPISDAVIFFRQLKSPLIYILLIAGAVSWYLRDFSDAIIIMAAVVINTVLGFYQERKAERGLAALKRILTPHARVMRDGIVKDITVAQVVPGDVVILAAGDKICADGILIETANLTINEAILTGESVPVTKQQTEITQEIILEKYPENSRVFMGTTVVGGLGKCIVATTGAQTKMGGIATSLKDAPNEETPLQQRFSALARTLTIVVILSAVAIFFLGLLHGESLAEIFATSVAVAVAAIPEGLVIALTAILALGMQRILKRKALVRKLVVAETLGTVTVIATDKTGTLTEGKLKLVKTQFVDKQEALLAATYANQLVDPLEFALWEWLTTQPKFDPEAILTANPRKAVIPFDSDHKYSASSYDHAAYFLGAPEVLIAKSTLSAKARQEYLHEIETWGRDGLRVLGLARKHRLPNAPATKLTHRDAEELIFLGLVGFADPVRPSVRDALALCREAGISIKVVTGDYRWTAEAVMRAVGIEITHADTQILEGEELEHLTVDELKSRIKDIQLFARVSPEQKLKIVEAMKKSGEVVALLGDGVNDAPALKRADIGIVVGEASDVARETADLVLLDSNFSTIVAAIEEGRGIFANIQKVLMYLLSDTFAEVTLIFLGLILGVPLPLTAAQILWINLVTDTLPTLALTMEPKEKNLLKRKPIAAELPLLSKSVVAFMISVSLISGFVVFGLYWYLLKTTDVTIARAVVFTAFSFKSLLYVFSLRDRNHPLWRTSLFANPWLIGAVFISMGIQLLALYVGVLQQLLHTHRLSLEEWGLVFLVGSIIVGCIELVKVLYRIFRTRRISP